jgi:uncharacterized membrane protein/predicted DsbA family dithiol-disulfide isomerase
MVSKRLGAVVGLVASIAPAIGGLVASAMLVVDTVRPQPVFCVEGGACDAMKHTAYATPLGVPLPLVGLAGFAVLGVVAVLAGARMRLAQVAIASVAGLVGIALLGVQASMGQLCPYCCVADACGVASAIVAAGRMWLLPDGDLPRSLRYGAAGGLVLGVVAPLAAGFHASSLPRVVRDEMGRTPKGEVTVIDFVDFECPFCRMTHAELQGLIEAHADRVRWVRRHVPLRIHAHALEAARAACCAERLGKGDAVANALFVAPVEQLTRDGCAAIALGAGVPADPYRACVVDPTTDARIEADRAEFKAAGGFALPTIWIDERPIVGAQPREVLAKALGEALARSGS